MRDNQPLRMHRCYTDPRSEPCVGTYLMLPLPTISVPEGSSLGCQGTFRTHATVSLCAIHLAGSCRAHRDARLGQAALDLHAQEVAPSRNQPNDEGEAQNAEKAPGGSDGAEATRNSNHGESAECAHEDFWEARVDQALCILHDDKLALLVVHVRHLDLSALLIHIVHQGHDGHAARDDVQLAVLAECLEFHVKQACAGILATCRDELSLENRLSAFHLTGWGGQHVLQPIRSRPVAEHATRQNACEDTSKGPQKQCSDDIGLCAAPLLRVQHEHGLTLDGAASVSASQARSCVVIFCAVVPATTSAAALGLRALRARHVCTSCPGLRNRACCKTQDQQAEIQRKAGHGCRNVRAREHLWQQGRLALDTA
mmetsp:Transcript_29921/g.85691  ORF Transcript_29921/g.85691 Transcript_29921/m.85691 type:complete len:370 (+) Transcript_29921:155-1264(+)